MSKLSFTHFGLVLVLSACSSTSDPGGGKGGSPGTGTGGGTSGGSAGKVTGSGGSTAGTGVGSGGTGGNGAAATGGVTTGGTGGTGMSGTGGVSTAGVGTGGVGTAGSPGGSAGAPIAGAAQAGGSAGMSAGGTAGSSAGTTGSGPGGTAGSGGASPSTPTVQLDKTSQTIQGFGLNDVFYGATGLPLDDVFTTNGPNAIGLSILRIGMTADGNLNGSLQANIDGAKSRGAKIIGSCWSPPGTCKTNGQTKDGGHLISNDGGKCYNSWSDTIASFAKKNGLYAMSIGNEPDFASCGDAEPCNGSYDTTLYTANEMVAFIKVAGPKLQANGVKVIAPEASEWIHTWSNQSATGSVPGNKNSSDPLKCGFPPSNAECDKGNGYDYGHWLAKDADAWKALDIMGVHEYDTQHAEPWPADVTDGKRTKEIWQTEMSGVKWWPEQGTGTGTSLKGSDTIETAVAVAGWIHSALTVGEASAWLWWWYSAYNTDDNEGLLVQNSSKLTRRYYALGNYSKFVRPGYTHVDVTGTAPADVLLSAYKGSDGTVVVVAINKGAAAATVPIAIAGGTAPASMTPNVTSATDNLAAKTAVPVTAGSFTATLPSKTITTFVGK